MEKERGLEMDWSISNRFDKESVKIADRHYNRQKPGTPQFVPPGRCHVLKIIKEDYKALWVTSWPFARYTKHAWAGAWVNTLFRNEGAGLSSTLILQAIQSTIIKWPDYPELGIITFVNEKKITNKINPGYCYLKAGFKKVGKTKKGLLAFQLSPKYFPTPEKAIGQQKLLRTLF